MSSPTKSMTDQERDELRQLLAKLRTDGTLIREKAKTLLEHLGLDECFHVLTDVDAPHSMKLETLKFLMRLADMEPKPNAMPATSDRFSININIPTLTTAVVPSVTIDAQPIERDPPDAPPDTLEGRYGDQAEPLDLAEEPPPPAPEPLRVRDFDLTGTPPPASPLLGIR